MTIQIDSPVVTRSVSTTSGHWIEYWNPEDDDQWRNGGRALAIRNLVFSIFAEHFAFSVWLMWSAVVVFLPKAGFAFSVDQLFWLVSIPALVGAFARLPYTFAVGRFGGRNWTVISSLLLLIPALGLVWCVSNPDTSYLMFVLVAATAGLGGGNFASSTANISFFFPRRLQGTALGVNAAGGNLGAATVQLLIPAVVVTTAGGSLMLAWAGWIWVIPILLGAVFAWFFMNNLRVSTGSWREQVKVAKYADTWWLSLLYIGTFGSFIGYSAAFPLLIKSQFADHSVSVAFLGALVGSLARPLGGITADRLGGARVTVWCLVTMGLGVFSVLGSLATQNYLWFFISFMVLFSASGAANGSCYRMIPVLFEDKAIRSAATDGASIEGAIGRGRREAAAVIGLTSAIGAIGGFLIPRLMATSIDHTGSIAMAMYVLVVFYIGCIVITHRRFRRRNTVGSGNRVTAGL